MRIISGTDSGPPCGQCFEHLWVYSYESSHELPHEVTVTCATCNAKRAPFECSIEAPTVQELRELHTERVEGPVQKLIHGRYLEE